MADLKYTPTEPIPEICTRCGNYQPKFWRIMATKECAAFGTCKGVKDNSCGAWCRRVDPPKRNN